MPHAFTFHPTQAAIRQQAKILMIGAPMVALVWALIVRLVTGEWSVGVPLFFFGLLLTLSALCWIGGAPGRVAFIGWRGFAFLLEQIIGHTCLLILFYLIFTPYGWWARRAQKLSFASAPEADAQHGYWQKLTRHPKPETYYRQS